MPALIDKWFSNFLDRNYLHWAMTSTNIIWKFCVLFCSSVGYFPAFFLVTILCVCHFLRMQAKKGKKVVSKQLKMCDGSPNWLQPSAWRLTISDWYSLSFIHHQPLHLFTSVGAKHTYTWTLGGKGTHWMSFIAIEQQKCPLKNRFVCHIEKLYLHTVGWLILKTVNAIVLLCL